MFLRLLIESFLRQRRRKLLAGIAILLGTTAVTAMLALATTIGDRIHSELAVYGANIIVTPKADTLDVKVGGVDLKPTTGGTYLHESDLAKLKNIFWANNITGISPELLTKARIAGSSRATDYETVGLWFNKSFGSLVTGAPALHPSWKITGNWPTADDQVVIGVQLANALSIHLGDTLTLSEPSQGMEAAKRAIPKLFSYTVTGLVATGDATDHRILTSLNALQQLTSNRDAVSRVEISARTKPEDAFARQDPDTLSPQKHEIWYCSPYANSIAYQIREAIPGADASQVRRVEQTEGTVLARISGLMWLVSLAALLAAGFAVSAAMATAVLERRREIGLMRSLGASKSAIAALFYSESVLLAIAAGTLGYLAGSALAYTLGAHIFPGDGASPLFLPVLLPVVVVMALAVAIAGSTPSIRAALRTDPATTLRGDA